MKSWFDTLKLYATLGLAGLLLAVASYAILQGRWLDDAVRDRDAAIDERDAALVTIDELQDNDAAETVTETLATGGREAIRAVPVDDHEQIAPVLLEGLRAADQIGGHQ